MQEIFENKFIENSYYDINQSELNLNNCMLKDVVFNINSNKITKINITSSKFIGYVEFNLDNCKNYDDLIMKLNGLIDTENDTVKYNILITSVFTSSKSFFSKLYIDFFDVD